MAPINTHMLIRSFLIVVQPLFVGKHFETLIIVKHTSLLTQKYIARHSGSSQNPCLRCFLDEEYLWHHCIFFSNVVVCHTGRKTKVRTSPVESELTNSLPSASNASPTGLTHAPGHTVRSGTCRMKSYPIFVRGEARGPEPSDFQGMLRTRRERERRKEK